MSRVFRLDKVENRDVDLSSLDAYGEQVELYGRLCSPFDVETYRQRLLDVLEESEFNAYRDYVPIVGRHINTTLGVAIIAAHFGRVQLLMWSSVERKYTLRSLTCPNPYSCIR